MAATRLHFTSLLGKSSAKGFAAHICIIHNTLAICELMRSKMVLENCEITYVEIGNAAHFFVFRSIMKCET